MTKIIQIKEFPLEYTAIIFGGGEVKRCNMVCGECGVKISEFLNKKLDGGAITAQLGICDMCGEKTYITNIRHYNI